MTRALLTVVLLLALAPAARAQDDFYTAPANLASRPNGTILQQRPVDVPIPLVTATQIQYRSTDALGTPIAAVTTLIVPQADYPGGPRPLVSYQMAYDSLAPQCTPSQTIPAGTQPELTAVEPLLQFGFAVAVPDYEGPRNAFAAGPLAGHTVLDGVRAARMLLSGRTTPTALYGYSAGGQAAAWAAELQPIYAPDVNILGLAAGGVPVDLEQLVRASGGTSLAGVGSLALFGLERQYNRLFLDGFLNDRGRAEKQEAGGECGRDFVLAHAGEQLTDLQNLPTSDPFRIPRVQRIIQQNRLGDLAPPVPVYLFHTTGDELVPVSGPDAVARRWCRDGAKVFYQRDEGGDHVGYPSTAGFPAYLWLAGRFAGAEVPDNCGTTPAGYIGSYCSQGHSIKFRLDRIRGERIMRVVVRLRGVPYKRKGGEALRRVVIRGLPPGSYRFTVTRYSRHDRRTRAYRRRIVCGDQ